MILASGAIGSPQLLMVSGVGPRAHLEELGIPVVADLKVGHNLQDHVGLGGLTYLVDEPVTFKKSRFQTVAVGLEYIFNERGPLTTGGVEGLAFVNSKYANKSIDFPDIQFHFAPSSVNSDGGEQIRKILGKAGCVGCHGFGFLFPHIALIKLMTECCQNKLSKSFVNSQRLFSTHVFEYRSLHVTRVLLKLSQNYKRKILH